MKRRSFEVDARLEGTLASAVASALSLERDAAASLVNGGAVYVNGRRRTDRSTRVRRGETILVVLEESGAAVEQPRVAPDLVVLFEDAALIAVDKPAGVPSQPTPGRSGDSLVELVARRAGRALDTVHRLDRETTGVVLFGKTKEATRALAAQFREGAPRKRYVAVCDGELAESGEIDLPISKDPSRPGRMRASSRANGAPAFTRFRRIASHDDWSLVALFPRTGRTHQLRAHLAALGHPIRGDVLYGGKRGERVLLHAQRIVVAHPSSETSLAIESPIPADLQAFFAAGDVDVGSLIEDVDL